MGVAFAGASAIGYAYLLCGCMGLAVASSHYTTELEVPWELAALTSSDV